MRIRIEGAVPDFGDGGLCSKALASLEGGGAELPLLRFSKERAELLLPGCRSPFFLDFSSRELAWRALHSGRHSEAVCRAVMGSMDSPSVFDATAGLGRDSFVLQCAGARVTMFERNPVVWALLFDALRRAREDAAFMQALPNGLPSLAPLGELSERPELGRADSVYYDPMFPKRRKNALVRIEMRVLQALAGEDLDSSEVLPKLLCRALRRVVVKRPQGAPRVCGETLAPTGSADGGACRYDIYAVT
ncbi:MAG: class I SAM-dependent methyltransferase [Succinivibrio sp.]